MITEAYIAGAIKGAIFKEEGKYFILKEFDTNNYDSVPLNNYDFSAFTLAKPEITHFENIEWEKEHLRDKLVSDSEKFEALNLFLIGMDKSLSESLRIEIMKMLSESLSGNKEIETFVRNRVFATKIPDEFDPLSASQISKNLGNTKLSKWYADLFNAKDIILAVRDAWKKTLLAQDKQTDLNLEYLDKEFTDRGIFSDFVMAALSKNTKNADSVIVMHSRDITELHISGPPAVFLVNMKNLLNIKQEKSINKELSEIKEEDEQYEKVEENDFSAKFNNLIDNYLGISKRKKIEKERRKIKFGYQKSEGKTINEQVAWIKDKIKKGDIDNAEEAILALIQHQDLFSDAEHLCKSLCDIAESFQKISNFEISDLIALKAANLNSNDPVPLSILAENLRAKGCFDDALIKYNNIIEYFKTDGVALSGKAETLRQIGKFSGALELYEETIERFPDDVVPRCGKAETLRHMGKLAEALKLYDETIVKFPDNVVALSGKAETLRQIGKLPEALELYEEIIVRFPDDVVALSGKAETLRQMGKLPEALELYEEIIVRFPDDVVALSGKAETLRQMGRFNESLSLYNQIIAKFPYNHFSIISRYVLLIQIGENLDKIEKEIIVSNPQTHDDWVQNHVHCMLLIKLNRIDEAISKLKQGVRNIKDIEDINYYKSTLSYAFIRKRNFKDAVKQLKHEKNTQPIYEVLITHAYAGDKNITESKKHFNKIHKSPFKKVDEVSRYLSDRYRLSSQQFYLDKSQNELEQNIENMEFDLLTESYRMAA
jgi:tetratricopeptide (TPR) repeat protein